MGKRPQDQPAYIADRLDDERRVAAERTAQAWRLIGEWMSARDLRGSGLTEVMNDAQSHLYRMEKIIQHLKEVSVEPSPDHG